MAQKGAKIGEIFGNLYRYSQKPVARMHWHLAWIKFVSPSVINAQVRRKNWNGTDRYL